MIENELDWLYWNRDRVSESDWWLWVDEQSPGDIVRLGEFWLDNLSRHNRAGSDCHLVASITHDYRQGLPLTTKQMRAVAITVREHWDDIKCGALD